MCLSNKQGIDGARHDHFFSFLPFLAYSYIDSFVISMSWLGSTHSIVHLTCLLVQYKLFFWVSGIILILSLETGFLFEQHVYISLLCILHSYSLPRPNWTSNMPYLQSRTTTHIYLRFSTNLYSYWRIEWFSKSMFIYFKHFLKNLSKF